jgi:hypothetical protein
MKKEVEKKIKDINNILKNSNLSKKEINEIEYNLGFVIGLYKGEKEVLNNILNSSNKEITIEKKIELLKIIIN